MPPFGALSPNSDNSTLSLHHFLTQGDIKTEKRMSLGRGLHMIIYYYHCNSDNALLLSFLLTCHRYILVIYNVCMYFSKCIIPRSFLVR